MLEFAHLWRIGLVWRVLVFELMLHLLWKVEVVGQCPGEVSLRALRVSKFHTLSWKSGTAGLRILIM